MDYFFHVFCLNIKTMFCEGMDLRKCTSTIVDLIDVRKKVGMFCSDFFYLNNNRK
jgi:hypothetical protein